MQFFANSLGQPLEQHLALTGLIARKLVVEAGLASSETLASWGKAALMAGILHDIGKADPHFQQLLASKGCVAQEGETFDGVHIQDTPASAAFSFARYPRHNEVSWYVLSQHRADAWSEACSVKLNKQLWQTVKYAVYWHHAKPLRDDDTAFASAVALAPKLSWLPGHISAFEGVLARAFDLAGERLVAGALEQEALGGADPVPAFKQHYEAVSLDSLADSVTQEARNSLVRSAVVTADRYVSGLSPTELAEQLALYAEERLLPANALAGLVPQLETGTGQTCAQIARMVDRFELAYPSSRRNAVQSQAAADLGKSHMSVLRGPAGCGKTKIMLQHIAGAGEGRQCFIFAPRTAIAEGLYRELIAEYGVDHSVEVVSSTTRLRTIGGSQTATLSGDEFSCDIVLATFDQLCSAMLSHRRVDLLTQVMRGTVIVDEFHELFDVPGVVLLFLELMKLRMATATPTLLVSATPLAYLVGLLDKMSEADRGAPARVVSIDSFNDKPFHLRHETFCMDDGQAHPFERASGKGDIFIANTASCAQIGALAALGRGDAALCFHSKFTPRHKGEVLNQVLAQFGVNGGACDVSLFAGPIVQASLNITTRHLHTEATTAENFLQRLGRANRFGTFEEAVCTLYSKTGKGTTQGVDTAQAGRLSQRGRTVAWASYVHQGRLLGDGRTLADLYRAYEEFHATPQAQKAYAEDFAEVLKSSAKTFASKAFDPIQLPIPVAPKAEKGAKLSVHSLRGGQSHYVLPLDVHYSGGVRQGPSAWLWGDSARPEDILTDDVPAWRRDDAAEHAEAFLRSTQPGPLAYASELPAGLRKLPRRMLKAYRRFAVPMARSPATPLVISFPSSPALAAHASEYLTVNGVRIGLIATAKSTPFFKKAWS